ncbi:MAG TPA: radical SAM/SPASM domain-containing protein [Bacteroidales bacterium]|nr:radical SAM/SPASM domain-containing protein [Bacteroidales bacterium]
MNIPLRTRIALELERLRRNNLKVLHPLHQLFWESTLRCNVSCLHCGSDCRSTSTTPDMPADDFLRVLDNILPHVNPHEVMVIISGGEPLMRADLARVGAEIYKREFPWGMVTNGLALTPAKFRELYNAGLHSLTISLDGLEAEHNWLRCHPMSFKRASQAINMMARQKEIIGNEPPVVWDVVTCVNQRTIDKLNDIKEYIISLGAKAWRLFAIAPMGRAKDNPELMLTDTQHRKLLDFIKDNRANETRINVSYCCESFLGTYEGHVRDHFYQCAAGISVASVLIDGSISGCTSVRGKYYQGNIYHDDFWEVWDKRFEQFRNRDWMRKTEPCKSCKVFRYCEGNGMHLRDEDGTLMACTYNKIDNVL